ncbi:MAG: ABC transporter permease [Anaerolineaceae bacterium]|nr:ABC transporter permease [Anaerolineaceae bacterium]
MAKFWRVFGYEYLRHVRRKRFIFALLSVPLFVIFFVTVAVLMVFLEYNPRPVGYVDLSNFLQAKPLLPSGADNIAPAVELRRYNDEYTAKSALEAKQIQAYFVIQADYLQTGRVRLVAADGSPSDSIKSEFSDFLKTNLLASQPTAVANRIEKGSVLTIISADGSRRMNSDQWLDIAIPVLAGILFIVAINTSGGYLLQAVVEEKENRTMEILVTSVSPDQLMAGKIAGNLSVGLTQLLAWILMALLAILLAGNFIPSVQNPQINRQFFWSVPLTLIPAFILVAAFMAALGATVTEASEAQPIVGLFTLPIMLPYWFLNQIMLNPGGPLATGMSFFPLTAPVTLPLRSALMEVPVLQVAVSISLLVILAAGAVWLAGRAFRLGMLRYGKRLSWKELFGRSGRAA